MASVWPQHQSRRTTKKKVTFVHNPYNSPLGLYSAAEVADTLQHHTQLLSNRTDLGLPSTPNLVPQPVTEVSCTMLTEEQRGRRPWQLHQQSMTSSTTSEVKRVAWPPVSNQSGTFDETNNDDDYMTGRKSTNKVAPMVPPKPAKGANWNSRDHENPQDMPNEVLEPFASNELVGERKLIEKPAPPPGFVLGRRLKEQAPISQEPQPVYSTESYFKRAGTTPVRMLGDMVWPPKGAASSADKSRETSRSPGTVRREAKDYRGLFSQHQLPPNFPTYRAPPGTQFFGLEDGQNTTAM